MERKKLKKITTFCLAVAIAFSLNSVKVNASPADSNVSDQAVAGISIVINEYYDNFSNMLELDLLNQYSNLGIVNVSKTLNVRKGPDISKEIIGKLGKNAGVDIIETNENGWARIKSGKIEGYVDASYLLTGKEALVRAQDAASLVGTVVDASALRIRESASTESAIIDLVSEGYKLQVIKVLPEWVQIRFNDVEGFVSRKYLNISYELDHAQSIEKQETSETGIRSSMVDFAKKYLGGRYVWGGTELGKGVDCSGFTQAIYKNFGYSIPRVSRSQATSGKSIKVSEARLGDLFFYDKNGTINHVAMYIGNGQVIHASNPKSGIKISNSHYKTPIKVVSYIN